MKAKLRAIISWNNTEEWETGYDDEKKNKYSVILRLFS